MASRVAANACLVVALAVGCGGGDERRFEASVSYDGRSCTTTIRGSIPAGRLALEVANRSNTSMDFLIGTYDDGYGRKDLLEESARLRPSWIANVGGTSVGGNDQQKAAVDLEAGRYYTLCLVDSPPRLIVLPDLIVEAG